MTKLTELAYSWIYFARKVLHFSISISLFDLRVSMQNLRGKEINQENGDFGTSFRNICAMKMLASP